MEVKIYTRDNCNWCIKAKELMNRLGMNYTELNLGRDYTREELRQLVYGDLSMSMTPTLTVPQIFIDGHRVGGYEEFADYCDQCGMAADAG